jgi:2',3'-cyclic-nucleotide 2'-phosphodiesterase (5'-nucleotidase family)
MSPMSRRSFSVALPILAFACFGPAPSLAASRNPGTLLVLSTADVRGMVSPCGCHIPKGGLPRRASYVDSLRGSYSNVLLVDGGGFVADPTVGLNGTPLLLDGMKRVGTDAVGVGDRDLVLGLAWLRSELLRTGMPTVCANLMDRKSGTSVFPPYLIKKLPNVTVGVFGLIGNNGDLGPARESLLVKDPIEIAKTLVPEMRAKGATVIVFLSQLGKVPTDDLTEAVEGVDVAIAGRNVPLMENAKLADKTVTVYAGDQGHYMGQVTLTLDSGGQVTDRAGHSIMMGPDIRDRADLAKLVAPWEKKVQIEAAKHGVTRKAGEVGEPASAAGSK